MSRRSIPVTVSLAPADVALLDELAQQADGNRSLVIRWMLRSLAEGELGRALTPLRRPSTVADPGLQSDRRSGPAGGAKPPSRARRHRRGGAPLTLPEVRAHRRQILRILRRHGMTNPRVFGSVARGEAKPGSDLDLAVDYQPREDAPMAYYRDWGEAKAALERLLSVSVDLFPTNELKPSIAAEIEAEGQPV